MAGVLAFLICGNGAYYTGISSHLENRLRSHQLADKKYIHTIKQWTKYRQPVQLAFKYEGLENLNVALKVERYIKPWKRQRKQMLIDGDDFSLNILKRFHQKKLEEYWIKVNTSWHGSQTLHPYTAHTQM